MQARPLMEAEKNCFVFDRWLLNFDQSAFLFAFLLSENSTQIFRFNLHSTVLERWAKVLYTKKRGKNGHKINKKLNNTKSKQKTAKFEIANNQRPYQGLRPSEESNEDKGFLSLKLVLQRKCEVT